MGTFIYGQGQREVEIDDRTLAHLKIVMLTKLRRNEAFAFSWSHGVESGSGRSTVWIHPTIPLEFRFYGSRRPALNRHWVEHLLQAANSAEGLEVNAEPGPSQDST